MRGQRTMLVWLLMVLILAGCRTQEPFLRPPKAPEEIAGVPPNDPRYNNPPQYPSDAMQKSGKKQNNNNNGPGGPNGAGSGMGGMRPPGISGPGMNR